MIIDDYIDLLQGAKSTHELNVHLQSYFNSYAIYSFAVTYYSKHIKTIRKLQYDWVSKPLLPWHEYYLSEGYANNDRTLENIQQITLPVYWDTAEQLLVAKNQRERQCREESITFGIDKGLSLPIHGPGGDFMTITLHQRKGEQGLKEYKKHQALWISAAHYYYHYLKQNLNVQSNSEIALSKREKQCLNLTGQGYRVEAIADQLNIKKRTVNFHIQNANRKLGSHNKYHSVNILQEYSD